MPQGDINKNADFFNTKMVAKVKSGLALYQKITVTRCMENLFLYQK